MNGIENAYFAICEAIQVMEHYDTGEDFALVTCLRRLREIKQAGINTNVGGPASASVSEGEPLPAEALAQNGRVDKCNCRYPKYNGYTCSNCDLPY